MWTQVIAGEGASSLTQLQGYEEALAEGQKGKLSLTLRTSVPSALVSELQDRLEGAGVIDAKVQALGNNLDIQFRKGMPWLAIIIAAVFAILVLAALIISWQLFKETKEVLPTPVIVIGAVVGIALVAVLVYTLAGRQIPVLGGR